MFGRKHFLDRDVEDWHVETWAWLIRNGGQSSLDDFVKTDLILPTPDFFPGNGSEGHQKAVSIFEQVRAYAGMENWPVKLVEQHSLPGRVSDLLHVEHVGTCAGTFRREGDHGLITYAPDLVEKPLFLIATFAHELGHFLNGQFPEEPPNGWHTVEPATDVTSTFLGFGLFGANTRFTYSQFQEGDGISGWQSERIGYLTEAQRMFDLAIFCSLTQKQIVAAKPYLKSHLWGELKKAAKYVEKRQIDSAVLALL